jgi:putative FmdB family regulatory protein
MPTYEYRCPEGHDFELFQKMSDKPRAKCPVCGRMATRQMSAGAGLLFKGSGFYITDYGKDGKGPRKETGDTAASDTGAGEKAPSDKPAESKAAEPKTESKPAKAEKPAKKAKE